MAIGNSPIGNSPRSPFDILASLPVSLLSLFFVSLGPLEAVIQRHGFHSDYTLGIYLADNWLDPFAASYAEAERIAVCPGRLFLNGSDPMCARPPRLGPCYSHMGDQQYDSHFSTNTPLHSRGDPSQRDREQVCTRQSRFLQFIVSSGLNANEVLVVLFLISLLVCGFKNLFF